MAERLTGKDEKGTFLIVNGCCIEKEYFTDMRETMNAFYAKQLIDKLCKLEDILEKYSIKSVEELDNLIANYKVSEFLTEDRIKEIAVNEQRKVIQSMVKEIVEKECNQLYTECNTWKEACKLALKEGYYAEKEYYIGEPPPNPRRICKKTIKLLLSASEKGGK